MLELAFAAATLGSGISAVVLLATSLPEKYATISLVFSWVCGVVLAILVIAP